VVFVWRSVAFLQGNHTLKRAKPRNNGPYLSAWYFSTKDMDLSSKVLQNLTDSADALQGIHTHREFTDTPGFAAGGERTCEWFPCVRA
jgi:hypothetical protein